MIRPEATPEMLIATFIRQFGEVHEWNGMLRIKWILNNAESSQVGEDELVLLVTKEKSKTL